MRKTGWMRQFPVHSGSRRELSECPRSVPWAILSPHEHQTRENHDQTLERLAQRGGLGIGEMVDIIEGNRWGTTKDTDAALICVKEHVAKIGEVP